MARSNWRRALVAAVLGTSVGLLSGCGTSGNTEVKDSWMARVPEERMGSVREAQAYKHQAQDEVARANVAIGDAERAKEVAQRNVEAAKLRRDAEKAQLKASQETGQQSSIQASEAQLQAAEAELQAAKAQVDWRNQNLEAWQAQRRLRERELKVAEAELNYAQYRALKENGDVRAQKLTEGDFLSILDKARKEARDARRDADEQTQQARQARLSWEQLRDRAQGYGGSGWNRR
jgi:colicin import membrane protein